MRELKVARYPTDGEVRVKEYGCLGVGDVKCVAVGDHTICICTGRILPKLSARFGKTHQPSGTNRSWPRASPPEVAEYSFVAIRDPDSAASVHICSVYPVTQKY